MAESSNNTVDALNELVRAQLLDVNTAIPGVIVSYKDGLAKVAPSIKKRFADGDILDYPIIQNVRVCWPSFAGGAAGIKGPVRPGDRCLIVISQQAVDGSDDRRMFDLQDAYAVMCDLGRAELGDSDNNADMTMFFGTAFIRITEAGELKINAPGGTTIDTPLTVNTGALTAQGTLTYQDGLTGTGTSTANGINLSTHTHPGDSGGTTGPPNP